jgi:hypothetical protein
MPNAGDFGFTTDGQLPGSFTPAPFNPDAHAHLIALGYRHTQFPCTFEDDGDAESGPHLTGGPAFDEYESDDDRLIIDELGRFAHWELRDLEAEKAEAEYFAQFDGDRI